MMSRYRGLRCSGGKWHSVTDRRGQLSLRVRSRRPDLLSVLGQENRYSRKKLKVLLVNVCIASASLLRSYPARSDTAADAARIMLEMTLRTEDGVPDVLVVDHDPKFTSALFKDSRGARRSRSAPGPTTWCCAAQWQDHTFAADAWKPAARQRANPGCGGPWLRPRLLGPDEGWQLRRIRCPALPAGPVHPRRRLQDADGRLRGRGRHAPHSCHQRLSLGLADPGRLLWLSPGTTVNVAGTTVNGTTVSVLSGSDPAGRIGCQLSVGKTGIKGKSGCAGR